MAKFQAGIPLQVAGSISGVARATRRVSRAHIQADGPGMIGNKGYQGTGLITRPRSHGAGTSPMSNRRATPAINRIRAAVECAIAHLKNWKILKTGYRRSLHRFATVLRTVTKLEMYRVYG